VVTQKLQAFRRRYYLNLVLRGSVILVLLGVSLGVAFTLSEGYFWLSTQWRTLLVQSWIATMVGVFGWWVVRPGLQYLNLTRTLTEAEAARLVGQHFPEIQDQLLNLLQLGQTDAQTAGSVDLLLASIEQKTEKFRPIPFYLAVNFTPNWRLARYIAVPLLLLLFFYFISPDVVTKGSYRLVNYSEHFVPPPPFEVSVPNHVNELIDGASHTFDIEVSGNELPAQLYMYVKSRNDLGYQKLPLEKKSASRYAFTVNNVHADFSYYIGNDLYGAPKRQVEVLQRPAVQQFAAVIQYPAYTGLPAETLASNVGDLTALAGSRIEWSYTFKGPVAQALFQLNDDYLRMDVRGQKAAFSRAFTQNAKYRVLVRSGRQVVNADTVTYGITITPDKYPAVNIQSPRPEASLPLNGILPLVADLSDDFGFSRAEFHFRFVKSNDPTKVKAEPYVVPLQGLRFGNTLSLEQGIDLFKYFATQGDEIEYYVKVWDNDAVSGPKATTSVVQRTTYRTTESLYEQVNEQAEALNKDLGATLEEARQLEKSIEAIQKKLLEKKNLTYEDKKQLQELIQQQQRLTEQMNQSQEKLEEQIDEIKENNLYSKEVTEKLEQLQKLMEQMDSERLKKLLENMQKNLDNMDPAQMKKMLEDFQKDQESFKEQIERTMELFKQLKVEQKVQELLQKLENLEQRQDLLNQKLDEAKTKEQTQQVLEKQKELNKEAEKLQKELGELKDLKNDTKTKDQEAMEELEQMNQDLQQEMQESQEQLEKMQKQKAGQSQKDAQKQMQRMQDKLQQMQQQSGMQQQQENMRDLRQLLDNLTKLSLDQEALRDELKKLRANDPQLNRVIQKQFKLKDDMGMVEDSLVSLAKRAFQIEQFVLNELKDVNGALKRLSDDLTDKRIAQANSEQHRVMTGQNNLANMLLESLSKMQASMKQMSKGAGMACPIPMPGQMNMQQLGKDQQQLNQQMQELMKKLQQGQSPGGEQLGELARKQAEIRKKMEELMQKAGQSGQPGGQGQEGQPGAKPGGETTGDQKTNDPAKQQMAKKIGEDMKQTEEQLKNKQLTHEMMLRQQQILNRMLDYDKALREQEYDNKRQSRTGIDQQRRSPADLSDEELRQRIRREQFSREKYLYTPGYQQLIDRYYQLLDQAK
jgi:hypothetical protein